MNQKTNFEIMSNREKISALETAKDLLKYLNDMYEDFPYLAYFEGTERLREAITFLDDETIRQELI